MSYAVQPQLYSHFVIPSPVVLRRFALVASTLKPPFTMGPPSFDQLLLPLNSFNRQGTHIHSFLLSFDSVHARIHFKSHCVHKSFNLVNFVVLSGSFRI